MIENRTTAFSYVLILLFGCVLFYIGTDGFTAYTAETARVNRLIENRPEFPVVTLEDGKSERYSLAEFKNKYVLITFMYTSCGTVCPQLEKNMGQVYSLLPDQYIGKDIVFLSLSFDPARDTPARLAEYEKLFQSDGVNWRMARIPDQNQLDSLLKKFGVIVIPDGNGNFAHNSAFYLVDRKGRLIEVMDYTKVDEAAAKISGILDEEVE
jgi:protein SCO1/2